MAAVDLQSFKSDFCGQVIEADDAGYDDARKIWNAIIDRRPKVIARCSGIADVVDACQFRTDKQSADRYPRRGP